MTLFATLVLQPSGEQNCCCQISTIGLTLLMCGWGGGVGSMLPLESCLALRDTAAQSDCLFPAERLDPSCSAVEGGAFTPKSVRDAIIRMTNSH